MRISRIYFALIICALFNIFTIQNTFAKSVFALSRHSDSNIRVYNTAGDQIEFQIESNDMSSAAIDLAACLSDDVIFASFDGSYKIELMNSKTMQSIKSISVYPEMAGLAYSQTYNWLFSAERYGSNISGFNS